MTTFLTIEYKKPKARVWRKTSVQVHVAGRPMLEREAPQLAKQEGWAEWRIVSV